MTVLPLRVLLGIKERVLALDQGFFREEKSKVATDRIGDSTRRKAECRFDELFLIHHGSFFSLPYVDERYLLHST
jgi:hypothetical protein